MNTLPQTIPWWFTDKVICKYLKDVAPLVRKDVLDLGCGRKRYKDMFNVETYIGLDIDIRCKPDVVASAKEIPFDDESFDVVLSTQVLSTIDDTDQVFHEVYRVLRPGGIFLFTVIFIGRLVDIPHDYWRFSEYGIRYLLQKHKFSVKKIQPMGGFLTTQCYLWLFYWRGILTSAKGRLIRRMANVIQKVMFWLLNPLCWFIHKRDKDTTTPFNYLAVGQKRLIH